MLQKAGVNVTCQTLGENVRTSDLVTNDNTPHVYGRDVAFDSCMWIITTP